jgi:hypothetical protein
MAQKTVPLNMKADRLWKARLDKTAEVLDVPYSQLVRESVTEKIEKLAKRNKKLAQALSEVEVVAA